MEKSGEGARPLFRELAAGENDHGELGRFPSKEVYRVVKKWIAVLCMS